MRRFIDVYGERPAHLVVMLACIAVAAYAATFLLGDPALLTVLIWFVGAALAHDMLLFPLYAAADRTWTTIAGRLPTMRVPIINHVRIPALATGLTLLMFLPGIIEQGGATHMAATGLDQEPYLARWLGLVVALVLTSAVIYGIRVVTGRPKVLQAATGGGPDLDHVPGGFADHASARGTGLDVDPETESAGGGPKPEPSPDADGLRSGAQLESESEPGPDSERASGPGPRS